MDSASPTLVTLVSRKTDCTNSRRGIARTTSLCSLTMCLDFLADREEMSLNTDPQDGADAFPLAPHLPIEPKLQFASEGFFGWVNTVFLEGEVS